MNLAARYGGDEFICILSDTDEEAAPSTPAVFMAVKNDPLMAGIGASAGVASYEEGMLSPGTWSAGRRRALRRAKSRRDG
jgi:GGDEF domain-containing protein